MRKFIIGFLIIGLILITGCAKSIDKPNSVKTTQSLTQLSTNKNEKQSSKVSNKTESSVENQITIPKLGVKDAIKMIIKATNINYNLLNNGGCKESNHPIQINNEYFYLCEPYTTKEEIQSFLGETFTQNVSNQLIESLNLKEINNKLAFTAVDVILINDWESAKKIDEKINGDIVIYRFEVNADLDGAKPEEIAVSFKYIPNKGWRIDTDPGKFH